MDFICNLCGHPNRGEPRKLDREQPSCFTCGSNVRMRGLLQALSVELFGAAIALTEFPVLKSVRGLGASDSHQYAGRLAERFDYRNTFYDRPPRFDLTNPEPAEFGKYDFLIASEVFEHVKPPVEAAFRNAFRLLAPAGFLLLTVPYSNEASTAEHFPELHESGLARAGDRMVLVNRTAGGTIQVFENLVFHRSGPGEALEMREFSQAGLTAALTGAGFRDIRFYAENCPAFGIVHAEDWSLPIVAHKEPFAFSADAVREVVGHWREMMEVRKKRWFRLGERLKLL